MASSAPAIATTGKWAARRRRVAELRRRLPFAGEVLDFYGALLPVQERAFEQAVRDVPATEHLAAYVAEVVVPSVVGVSLAAGPARLRQGIGEVLEREAPARMVARWISGENADLVERYLARAALEPVLDALGERATAAFSPGRGARSCPVCGGPPQLSYFAPAGEDLATGPRRLLCARCSSSWGHARMTCPGCGEDSSSRLPIFSEEGTASGERGSVVRGLPAPSRDHPRATFPHLRIAACTSCHRYLIDVDLALDPAAVPEVDELAALPLDLYARERRFTKIIPNLMGF